MVRPSQEGRDRHFVRGRIEDKFKVTDVTSIDGARLRAVAVVPHLGTSTTSAHLLTQEAHAMPIVEQTA
jgi:hypothetical protein